MWEWASVFPIIEYFGGAAFTVLATSAWMLQKAILAMNLVALLIAHQVDESIFFAVRTFGSGHYFSLRASSTRCVNWSIHGMNSVSIESSSVSSHSRSNMLIV